MDNSTNGGAGSSTNNTRLDSSSTKYCGSSCERSLLSSFKRLLFNISGLHLINSMPLPLGRFRLALFLPLCSTVRHLFTLLDPLLVARICVVDAADLVVLGGALLRRDSVAFLSLHQLAELLELRLALGIVLGLTRCAVLRL